MSGTVEQIPVVHDRTTRERRVGWVVVVAAIAVLVGLAAGWVIFGNNDDSSSDNVARYVTPGSVELTERQTEMVELVDQYMAAWSATDGQRLETLMVEGGHVEYAEQGWRFDLEDGSLQDRVSNGPYDSIRTYAPMLVYEDRIVLTGRVDSIDVEWLSVVRFTTSGEVKVISETIYL